MTGVPFRRSNNPTFDPTSEAHPWMSQLEDRAYDAVKRATSDEVRRQFSKIDHIDAILWQIVGAPATMVWQQASEQLGFPGRMSRV